MGNSKITKENDKSLDNKSLDNKSLDNKMIENDCLELPDTFRTIYRGNGTPNMNILNRIHKYAVIYIERHGKFRATL